jgi:flagellar biogenesis protein FliO
MIRFVVLFFFLTLALPVWADSTVAPMPTPVRSVEAEQDSVAAAYKMEALSKALGVSGGAGTDSASGTPALTNPYQAPQLGKVAVRMAVGLGVVRVLLYVLYRMARKVKGLENADGLGNSTNSIQVLETRLLGGGQKIVLVRVGPSAVLALGSTANELRTLAEIQGPDAAAILESHRAQVVTASQFSDTVDHLLRRFKRDGGEP